MSTFTLSAKELKDALDFVAPDQDEDQLETELTIYFKTDDGKDNEGEPMPKGWYCFLTEYPEEGVYGPLGADVVKEG